MMLNRSRLGVAGSPAPAPAPAGGEKSPVINIMNIMNNMHNAHCTFDIALLHPHTLCAEYLIFSHHFSATRRWMDVVGCKL